MPEELQPLITACCTGDLATAQALWHARPGLLAQCRALGRDDTCHPLLNAVHHMQVDVVRFLLNQGLSPRARGTVHPYTGDGMTRGELQAITPLELTSRMLFLHQRKSKRRDAIVELRDLLEDAAARHADAASAAEVDAAALSTGAEIGDEQQAGAPPRTPLVSGASSAAGSRSAATVEAGAASARTITPSEFSSGGGRGDRSPGGGKTRAERAATGSAEKAESTPSNARDASSSIGTLSIHRDRADGGRERGRAATHRAPF